MKAALLSLTAISLIQLAAAQPHKRHNHVHEHEKRDQVVTIVETVVALATAAPVVVVYVDQNGKPVSTVTEHKLGATPSLVTLRASTTSTSSAVITSVASVTSVASTSSTSTPAPTTTAVISNSAGGFGYAYSPYNADDSCKTAEQVEKDIAGFDGGVGLIRTYGTDCNTVSTVYPAAKKYKLKLFAGIYSLNDIAGQVKLIVDGVKGDWSSIHTISVGNELVDSHQSDAGSVIAAMKVAKGLLAAAGYTGPVVVVDTLQAALKYPTLCDESDYCAVNCHPFFDPNTEAQEAGQFIVSSIATLKSKLANSSQKIVITETGWPYQGNANSKAVPTKQNQQAAISSIKSALNPSDYILLSPYDTLWKENNALQFNAEQFWGLLGTCPSES